MVAGFPPKVVAVAVLWTAAKAAGVPRPLRDLLRCSKAEERRVRKTAWRLKETVKLGRRPSIEDYVKTLVARVNLPASIVKTTLDIMERNRRLLSGKNPWVSTAAALWPASFKKAFGYANGGGWVDSGQHKERRREDKGMSVAARRIKTVTAVFELSIIHLPLPEVLDLGSSIISPERGSNKLYALIFPAV